MSKIVGVSKTLTSDNRQVSIVAQYIILIAGVSWAAYEYSSHWMPYASHQYMGKSHV